MDFLTIDDKKNKIDELLLIIFPKVLTDIIYNYYEDVPITFFNKIYRQHSYTNIFNNVNTYSFCIQPNYIQYNNVLNIPDASQLILY